jgi:hypothetical protein
MTQHLQQNMPAHLRQYVEPGNNAYIPAHIQADLAKHMQKMPGHLQQYGDAFLQQRVFQSQVRAIGGGSSSARPHPTVISHTKLDHSMPGMAQHTANPENFAAARNQFQNNQPLSGGLSSNNSTSGTPNEQPSPPISYTPYDFIVNPDSRPYKDPGNSLVTISDPKMRLIAAGGVLVIVLFAIFLIFGRKSVDPAFAAVAERQVEIARVAALDSSSLTNPATIDFAVSTNLNMTSAEHEYVTFLGNHGVKLSTKLLAGGQNSQTDKTFASALESGTFDATFQQTLQSELTSYQQSLKAAYAKTTNTLTRAELSRLYQQATLLLQQSQQTSD